MSAPPDKAGADGAAHSHVAMIGGQRIHYVQTGTGRTVLLVHGIAASIVDWHLNIPALAEHFTVIAVDLPGYGESDIPSNRLSIRDAAPFLDAFLGNLGLDRVSLVGNSMGGLICGHYAMARPERVDRLLMVDPAGLAREVSIHFRLLSLPFLGEWALRPNPNAGRMAARGLFADPARAPEPWLQDKILDRGPASRTYLLQSLRSGTNILGIRRQVVMLDGLRSLAIPTMVMWGAHDHVVPLRHLDLVKTHLPNARTHVFPNAGHVPMLECPDEFNRLAIEFLRA